MAFTTWNPSDASVSVTFSNGNLTITSAASGDRGARVVDGKSSGKYYFETAAAGSPSGDFGIGASEANANFGNLGATATDGVIIYVSGNIWVNGSNVTASGLTISSGTNLGIAIDTTNKLFWATKDGTHWNSTSSATNNPATGIGGVSFSALTGPFYIAGIVTPSGSNWTLNAGASAFSFTPPLGFTSGWPAAVAANVSGMLFGAD